MSDPALEALWKNVLDNWDEDKAHGAFLEHCQRSDQLVEAAVRYRGMKGDRERGEVAEKRLQGVAMLAMAQLEASRSSAREPETRRVTLFVALLFLLAALGLLLYLAGSR
jgi:hypothetical protein